MVATVFIVIGIILVLLGIVIWSASAASLRKLEANGQNVRNSTEAEGPTVGVWIGRALTVVGILLGLILTLANVFVVNGQGEAKVITNIDGSVSSIMNGPSTTVKAPWQDTVDFDLFSQELLYAGGDTAPSYSGGTVSGKEVTVSVGGLNGGSTQANVDISVTYSLDGGEVENIYTKYRTQERFTKQVIEKTILSAIRTAPTEFTAIEFRGAKKDAAAQLILDKVNDKLNALGVTIDFVNIQAIRYPDNVETALNDVEAANQQAAKAEATQRTKLIEAETARIEAQGIADANAILNTTLTPEVLQRMYIEALADGTIYVVPDGSTPFIGTK